MIQQIFEIVMPLLVIVMIGYFYGARVRPEMRITNQLVMDIFMPALIFHVMIQEDFYPAQYAMLMLAGTLLILGSGVAAFFVARILGFSWRSFMPPAMFSNWANLGLPLYVLALGDIALDGGVMLIVVGNIICFTIGTYIYSGQLSGMEVMRTPIILAVILGAVINALNITFPAAVMVPIDMLGKVAIPIMLFSLGVRLTRVSLNDSSIGLVMAALCPIVGVGLALLLCAILPLNDLHQNILILFGVLPPAVINFMLAEQYNTDPDKVASMVMIGNLFSIITIPLALYFVLNNLS